MKVFIQNNRYFLSFILIYLIAEIVTNPLGNFPLNDDWAYAHAVELFNKKGIINFGSFPAMTLYSHIIWGALFTKFIGFSFLALRFSTFISSIIGFVFLNKLVIQITNNKLLASLACIVLLFNPVFFNLSNTFMTDINFNTLSIVCSYLAYHFFLTKSRSYYFGFLITSILIVLLRQYGIIFPLSFTLANFFTRDKKIFYISISFLSIIVVFSILKIYESYLLKELPKGSTYKFSSDIKILDAFFWSNLTERFSLRHKEIIQHVLVYTCPLTFVFFIGLFKRMKIKILLLLFIISVGIVAYVFKDGFNTSASVFSRMIVGPETFYESFKGARHNSFPKFENVIFYVAMLFSFITVFVLTMSLTLDWRKYHVTQYQKQILVFLFGLVIFYVIMLLITESFFDRYHLPLITFGLIILSWIFKDYHFDSRYAILPLIFWTWISIFGTKDYFELNRLRWEAYTYLRNELKIPKQKINAGFEVRCWNEGSGGGWRDFLNLDDFDYLIQYNSENGFVLEKSFEFQRYFPYKKDKINIYVRHK